MEKELAPIILFVYNRPDHTKKTLEGILTNPEAKNSILYIFADGAKSTITKEGLLNFKKTREFIHKIKGFSDIIIDESDINRGLAEATIRGCGIVIEKHGKMIMIEDDDVPSPFFLNYMNECLNKYANDEKIWSVCGYVDNSAMPPREGDDAFLVNRPSSWGFGTWKRCWEKVIWDQNILKGLFKHKDIIRGFDKWGGRDHYHTMYNFLNGNNSSWSIRYHFAAYLNGTYSIYPNKTLIENIGCDGSGTHCGNVRLTADKMNRPVYLPDTLHFDEKRNHSYIKHFYPFSLKSRLTYFSLYHPTLFKIARLPYRIIKQLLYK